MSVGLRPMPGSEAEITAFMSAIGVYLDYVGDR